MVLFERQPPASDDRGSAKKDEALPDAILNILHSSYQVRSIQAGSTIADNDLKGDLIYYLIKGSVALELLGDGTAARFEFKEREFLRISPRLRVPSTACVLKASSDSRFIEIQAEKLELLPDKVQIAVLTGINQSEIRVSTGLMVHNSVLSRNLNGLTGYVISMDSRLRDATSSNVIQDLITKIPKLPNFAFDLISKLQDKTVETKEVVSSIQSDPSLASLILKTINSSYYGLAEKISDVYRAVLLLGFNNIYQLLITQGLSSIMPKDPESLDIQAHSSLISVLSQEIATMSGRVSPPRMATQALLHDIGRIVVLLLKHKYPNIGALFDLLDTSLIGARLLRAWGLPENICEVVEHHTKAQFVPAKALRTDHRAEIAVLYLSHLCHDHYAGNRQPVETFLGEYMSLLGFPAVSGTVFAQEKVLPVLLGGIKRFPEHVRNFIKKAASGGREPV